MASKKEFVEYVCSQLSDLGEIKYRPMMGEYLIYVNGKYCVGICNNQVFLKPVKKVKEMFKEVIEQPMYDGAKFSYLITDIDDREYLTKIVKATYEGLPEIKKKN
ncbi:MAG: TfoX/Sxy family protein [Bacilli bacterium]|nr:TfoX/Sxy family protein [Bacilli bacterium]